MSTASTWPVAHSPTVTPAHTLPTPSIAGATLNQPQDRHLSPWLPRKADDMNDQERDEGELITLGPDHDWYAGALNFYRERMAADGWLDPESAAAAEVRGREQGRREAAE